MLQDVVKDTRFYTFATGNIYPSTSIAAFPCNVWHLILKIYLRKRMCALVVTARGFAQDSICLWFLFNDVQ